MVNTEDFIKRIEIILDYYSLNASSFADKIGIQRSSMSHLLSGRNKPSLDFILKILDVFPEVDLYWFLNGKGTFPKSESVNQKNDVAPTPIVKNNFTEAEIEKPQDLFLEKKSKNQQEDNFSNSYSDTKNASELGNKLEIDRIVIFYKNGVFKTYTPE